MDKICSKCKETKPTTEFYKNKARYDGFCNFCKICDKSKPINKEKAKQKYLKWRNSPKGIDYFRAYYQANKEKYRENHKKWVSENHEKYKSLQRGYFQRESRKRGHAANMAKRRFIIQKSTWLPFVKDLNEIYKNCPKGYHVDHIVPLIHKDFCGLHVPWNLQYLPAKENLRKSNKYEQ